MNTLRVIFLCLVGILFPTVSQTAVKKRPFQLTNVSCESLDEEYARFNNCALEKNPKGGNHLNMYLHILKPFSDIQLNAKLFRKVNQNFDPFVYDDLIDFCEFVKNTKNHVFWGLMYRTLTSFSNLNHTCPYDHDVIVSKLILDVKEFNMLPLPRGQYMVQLLVAKHNAFKLKVKAYFLRN